MKLTRGKIVIIIISVGIAIFFAGFYAYGKWQEEMLSDQVNVELVSVNVTSIDKESRNMTMKVDIGMFNNSELVLTVFDINYELFANDSSLGKGQFSAKDRPLTARPAIFSQSNLVISSDFKLKYSDEIRDIWNVLVNKTEDDIRWKIKGTAIIQSAFVEFIVDFESTP